MYLMDIGREKIIIILLLLLIYKTKITSLRIIFIITLFIHLYKLIKHYKLYYINTIKYIYIYILLFIVLLYTLYLFFFKNKQIYFIICFIIFRIITSYLNNYKEISPILNNNLNIINFILPLVLYYIYDKYKYKNIFLMDSINHLLLFIGL